jgi:hypothetical protein
VKSGTGLNPISEFTQQAYVFRGPSSTCCPIAKGRCVPPNVKVLEVLEHRDRGRTSGTRGTIEMKVRYELAWSQETGDVRVVHQGCQVAHRGFENRIKNDVGLTFISTGHHPNISARIFEPVFAGRPSH